MGGGGLRMAVMGAIINIFVLQLLLGYYFGH